MPQGTLVELSVQEIRALEDAVENELKRIAVQDGIAPSEAELVVRDILPETDLNAVSGEVWVTHTSAYAWNTVFSGENPENKAFAIYGVTTAIETMISGASLRFIGANVSGYPASKVLPSVVAIKFGLGAGPAKIKDIWHIQHMYTKDPPRVFSKSPVVYRKKEKFTIQVYGTQSMADHIVLLGKVVEPKGQTILGGS